MNVIEEAKRLKNSGKTKEAINLLENFIERNKKERVGAHKLLSDLYVKSGDLDRAADVLKTAIRNNPDNLWLYLMLGDLYLYDFKNPEKAKETYKKGLSYFSEPVKTTMSPYRYFLKRLSNLSYEEGDLEDAKKYFELFSLLDIYYK